MITLHVETISQSLLKDAFKIANLEIERKAEIGWLLSVVPLDTVTKILPLCPEMTKLVQDMSEMHFGWADLMLVCDQLLERHGEKLKLCEIFLPENSADEEAKTALRSMILETYGADAIIKIKTNPRIQDGFMLHISSLGILLDYSNNSFERVIERSVTEAIEGVLND